MGDSLSYLDNLLAPAILAGVWGTGASVNLELVCPAKVLKI